MKIYFQNRSSVHETHRTLRPFYARHNRPSEKAIRFVIGKFRITYSLQDVACSLRDPMQSIKIDCLVWSTCQRRHRSTFLSKCSGRIEGQY